MNFWIVIGTIYEADTRPLLNGFSLYHSKNDAIVMIEAYNKSYQRWEHAPPRVVNPTGVQEIEICSDRLIMLMLQHGTTEAMNMVRRALLFGETKLSIIKHEPILLDTHNGNGVKQ